MKTESALASAAHWTKRIGQKWCSYALALAAVTGQGVVMTPSAQAQTFTVLYAFTGRPRDGRNPHASLVMDQSGNLYGETPKGAKPDMGTVFKVDKTSKETVLYKFVGGTDGAHPYAALVMDAKGNLYGTTYDGGTDGYGTVFKVNNKGQETVLYSFAGRPDGAYPYAGLVMDARGNLYGTTQFGGKGPCGRGCGTVFKLDTKGTETVLHTFAHTLERDGAFPYGGLVMDAKGNLYGTTFGTSYDRILGGYGTVFKVNNKGQETVLYSFYGSNDGGYPYGGLVMDANGNLYGTTSEGGTGGGGTVFKVTKAGKETVLYSFTGGSDGYSPEAGLVMDAKGNLYGTTVFGGGTTYGFGTVFKVNSKGKETVLYRFTGGSDGAHPFAGVIMDAQGNLYGTAWGAGDYSCNPKIGCGTVFKVTP